MMIAWVCPRGPRPTAPSERSSPRSRAVAVEGQEHGGIAQGLGLAVMEEIRLRVGRILNPSFTGCRPRPDPDGAGGRRARRPGNLTYSPGISRPLRNRSTNSWWSARARAP
ncbi:molybdopterin cofactor-binding domain-containing protein [Nonomuraea aridisoli]|uniref:molybdopterin cofactor-binding domain-containing protein n=1 Tax=Nonomuraea aridisoli TaxID=2070368 RepID=UPI000DA812F2